MANPTYQSGFYAPGRGTAKYPELWDGCVGAWNPGLGNTGLCLRDWSGNQNNGTLTNGPTWGVSDGRQALDFDGVDDEVQCGTTLLNGLAVFTYSVWCYQRTSGAYVGVLGKYASTTSDTELLLVSASILQTVRNGSGSEYRQSASVLTLNEWQHLVVVFDGSQAVQADRMRMYRNGVSLSLSANSLPATVTTNAAEFKLGSYPGPAGGRLDGRLDDTRIYNRALSPNEIRTLAQRPGIAYERAPRKSYFLPPTASTRQYKLLRPSILRGA